MRISKGWRMNARSKAQVFLEALQEREYTRLGLLESIEKRRELMSVVGADVADAMVQAKGKFLSPQELEEFRARLIKTHRDAAIAQLPSRFQDPLSYALV